MQIANAPLKWLIPWASQNASIYELPATTSTTGAASQSQGFPAITMLPPESGGQPPQGTDFNAGLYQVARIAWWLMYGGAFAYDATFATNVTISGYAQGSNIASSDYLGDWLNTTDNNQVNPDTTGTGWVPGYVYGSTTTALTNANVTLTPLQAAKKTLIFTGTLTGNVVVTVPAWIYDWTVLNQCSGAFTLTLTTASGAGVVIPQGGSTRVRGDGTNINRDGQNVPTATLVTEAMPLGQATGRLLNVQVFTASGTYTPSSSLVTSIIVEGVGGGGGGGGCPATTASQQSVAWGGQSGAWARARFTSGFTGGLAVTIGAAGTGGAAGSNPGTAGGATSLGSILVLNGGAAGTAGVASTSTAALYAPIAATSGITAAGTLLGYKFANITDAPVVLSLTLIKSGGGGDSPIGVGGRGTQGLVGTPATGYGAGGGGCSNVPSGSAGAGGNGAAGVLYIYEYA
jgi:hypothetical protein